MAGELAAVVLVAWCVAMLGACAYVWIGKR